jgi:transcriptional regulator with XRE-family HTH domain
MMLHKKENQAASNPDLNFTAEEALGEIEEHRFGELAKAFRVQRGLSLRELAQRTGLSVGMLSQIERNVTSPSLKTLTKLRIGLDVPLSAFFGDDEGQAPDPSASHVAVRKKAARPTLDIGDGILKVLLSPAAATNLQLMVLIVEPKGGTKDTVIGIPGEKAVVVMQGVLEITVGDATHTLQEGDTLQFDAELPHSFRNPGKNQAQVMWVIAQLPAQRHI